MNHASLFGIALMILVTSCASAPPVYISNVPEDRAERAILSNIDLIGEFPTSKGSKIGVFLSHEIAVTSTGDFILFAYKGDSVVGSFAEVLTGSSSVSGYSLASAGSISAGQATGLLRALKEYAAKSPKDISPGHLYNFELYAGVLDNSVLGQRRFGKTTFAMIFSITSSAKALHALFPGQGGLVDYQVTDQAVSQLITVLGQALSGAKDASPSSSPGDKSNSSS